MDKQVPPFTYFFLLEISEQIFYLKQIKKLDSYLYFKSLKVNEEKNMKINKKTTENIQTSLMRSLEKVWVKSQI